ncbi:MAG TPA: hypothetical protein DCQ64_31755 [Candidatus Rokubacteria bacterium]|nr:hypothetical protein [Candidatus Rokubacteria bacterium]
MDPELSQAFETLEQRIRQGVAGEIRASEARLREYVDATVRASAEETRQYVDASARETRRHAGVLAEGLRADFRIATEGIMPLDRRTDALEVLGDQTRQRVDLLEGRVSVLERAGKTPRPRRRR